VRALIEGARLSLKSVTTIKGSHTRAKKAIDDAGRQLGDLAAELTAVLDELEEEVVGVD
jgi:hypothetical protein